MCNHILSILIYLKVVRVENSRKILRRVPFTNLFDIACKVRLSGWYQQARSTFIIKKPLQSENFDGWSISFRQDMLSNEKACWLSRLFVTFIHRISNLNEKNEFIFNRLKPNPIFASVFFSVPVILYYIFRLNIYLARFMRNHLSGMCSELVSHRQLGHLFST